MNYLVEKKGDEDQDIIVEVADNEEESEMGDTEDLSFSVHEETKDYSLGNEENFEENRRKWAVTKFDPFTEDVFSLGLTILQVAYQCSGPELKQMRSDPETLTKSVEQLNEFYSAKLCCILLLMLQWESSSRPDFLTLQKLIQNIIQIEMEQATILFQKLCQ